MNDLIEALEVGRVYELAFECRDIGYGVESGYGEYVYRRGPDWTGKHEFQRVGDGQTIYLFPDEITEAY
jgi:hypothetical protein